MTDDGKLEQLREQRRKLWKNVKASHVLLVRAHTLCESLESRYNHDKKLYEEVDHELAMLDGRLKICDPAEASTSSNRKRRTITVELNPQEMIALLKKMGFKLEEPDELSASGETQK